MRIEVEKEIWDDLQKLPQTEWRFYKPYFDGDGPLRFDYVDIIFNESLDGKRWKWNLEDYCKLLGENTTTVPG